MTAEDDRFTRDDLDRAGVQVEALRQDLAGYRITIERALTKRNRALIAAALGVFALLVLQAVGGWLIVRNEAQRADALRDITRLQSCQQVAELRADLVRVLVKLGGEDRFAESIEILRPGECTIEEQGRGGAS